jgi:hypothetical protein
MSWQAIAGCLCTLASVAPQQLLKVWMEEAVTAAEQDFPSILVGEEADLMAAEVLRWRGAARGGASGSGSGSGGGSGGAKAH